MPIKNGPLVDGAWQIRGGHQTTINAFFGNYSAWGLRGLSCLNPSRNTCSKTETWPPTIFLGLDASITFRSVFRTKEEGTSAVTVRSWPSAFYLHRPRYKPPFLKFPSLRASSYFLFLSFDLLLRFAVAVSRNLAVSFASANNTTTTTVTFGPSRVI